MNERTHEQKVKDVAVDDDCLVIELLSGLRLSGPMHTKPVYRERVVPAEVLPAPAGFVRAAAP